MTPPPAQPPTHQPPTSKSGPSDIDLGTYAQYDRLLFDLPSGTAGGVLRITLNNPEKFNATDAAVHLQLSRIFRTVHDDESVRAVVVTGAGRAFSAGGDLDWISEQVGDYTQTMRVRKEALMADVSIMNESAKLTDGHIRLGVGAGDHAVAIWPLLCGMAKAKYYLLTADFVDGKEAERIGLVSKAVPVDDVMTTALEVADKLSAGPVDATRLTKRALNHWIRQALPNFEASLAYEMLNFLGPDAAEGLAALKEKRAPNFHGVDETAD